MISADLPDKILQSEILEGTNACACRRVRWRGRRRDKTLLHGT